MDGQNEAERYGARYPMNDDLWLLERQSPCGDKPIKYGG